MNRYKIIAINETRVLIIEDNPENLSLFKTYITSSQFATHIETATTLRQAREAIANNKFDLIVADAGLPDGSSLELLSTEDELGTQPILVVTGNPEINEENVFRMGGQMLLYKPIFNKGLFIDACKATVSKFKPIKLLLAQKKLLERQKITLDCYKDITELFEKKGLDLQETIEAILKIIYEKWCEHPDSFAISISINGAHCQTDNYIQTDKKVEYPMVINGKDIVGTIKVYSNDITDTDGNVFLAKEFDQFLKDISNRVAYLYEKRESHNIQMKDKALFQAIFESSDNPKLILAEDGKIVRANRSAIDFTGHEDEIMGKKFIDLNWSTVESQQELIDQAIQFALNNKAVRLDYFCISPKFEYTHFSMAVIPVRFGFKRAVILEATNNTEYKTLLHKIKQFEGMVLGSNDAYVAMKPTGKLTIINPAWETITGYPMGKINPLGDNKIKTGINGKFSIVKPIQMDLFTEKKEPKNRQKTEDDSSSININNLLKRESAIEFWQKVNQFFRSNPTGLKSVELGEYELIAKDGTSRFVKISIMPQTEDNRLIGYFLKIHDNTELKKNEFSLIEANSELNKLASKDPLTDLFNRRIALERIEGELKRADRFNRNMGLIMMDLDHFKNVNDTYGHDVGDFVLKKVSMIIQRCCGRAEDMAARWGGEEFLIMLPEIEKKDLASRAEIIRKEIENYKFIINGKEIPISASFGCVSLKESKIDPRAESAMDQLIKKADDALYKSKETGRNKVTMAEER
ncbi:MAG: hypothetical protein A2Y40_02900 [Candidatus Margulisbacteria bacterium GWF2_35_9]|nr:MAG: hypothetical protein A2Y40_02900 [Candidatus Margulisbacteria bacterium GWF2_35_9]